ncbi:MAG: copper resistance protein NlpE N-terminal domain-containing protein [Ginsengibacter sp.]
MKLVFLFLVGIILHSCNQDASQEKDKYVANITKVSDSTTALKATSNLEQLADSLPTGAYQGILPCTSCKGLQQTVIFYSDKTYQEEQVMLDKNNAPKKGAGIWDLNNDKIELKRNNKVGIVMLKKNDSLFFTSINGVTVKDPFKYILTKKNLADSNDEWNKKRAEGIDFIAMGTKPSWNIEIKNQQFILFKLADWKKPLIAAPENPITNNDSTLYKLKKDTTRWSITIFPQICSDGMSDTLYRYKVNVHYKGFIYKGCGVMLSKKKLAIKLSKVHSVHKMNYH